MRRFFSTLALTALLATPAMAQNQCGGSFSGFVNGLKKEARANGHAAGTVDQFFANVQKNQKVLDADRRQGVFQMDFTSFSRRLISQGRINTGVAKAKQYAHVFDQVEQHYGVSRGVLLAFWAFETDYGGFQGDFNTLNSLVTLAHDCRRPHLFRPQIFAALDLYAQGDFSPTTTTGAWAGEIGMVQMLPADILQNGVDGDGDGKVSLKTSAPDALMSGGKMLQHLGWRAGEPWLQEVTVPQSMDWSLSGTKSAQPIKKWQQMGVKPRNGAWLASHLDGKLILPQGRKGPAFIAYPNFDVYFEWNQSFTYVLTAAYFGTRLMGGAVFDAGSPDPALSGAQMKQLQSKLSKRGHDVGKIDGILGAGTRAAVQAEQKRLGLPADAWPTTGLLNKL
ncbi:MAG: lytic murein transglycosylase [Thalassovita sp.]